MPKYMLMINYFINNNKLIENWEYLTKKNSNLRENTDIWYCVEMEDVKDIIKKCKSQKLCNINESDYTIIKEKHCHIYMLIKDNEYGKQGDFIFHIEFQAYEYKPVEIK